jgi:hypothetical protein
MRRLLAASLFVVGCGAEAPAPDKPTWADDVLPILQANCFHCHGPTANYEKYMTKRWDVLDLSLPPYAELGFTEDRKDTARTFLSANSHFDLIPTYLLPEPTTMEDTRMPPPPAPRLSARDAQVLANFKATGFTPGSHHPNHKPAIAWQDRNKTFFVTDQDGDQVLGKLDCGGTEVAILFAGRHTLPSGVTGPCSGALHDGWGGTATTVNLK